MSAAFFSSSGKRLLCKQRRHLKLPYNLTASFSSDKMTEDQLLIFPWVYESKSSTSRADSDVSKHFSWVLIEERTLFM